MPIRRLRSLPRRRRRAAPRNGGARRRCGTSCALRLRAMRGIGQRRQRLTAKPVCWAARTSSSSKRWGYSRETRGSPISTRGWRGDARIGRSFCAAPRSSGQIFRIFGAAGSSSPMLCPSPAAKQTRKPGVARRRSVFRRNSGPISGSPGKMLGIAMRPARSRSGRNWCIASPGSRPRSPPSMLHAKPAENPRRFRTTIP